AGIGVVAERADLVFLFGTAAIGRDERINAAGGEGDGAGFRETLGDVGRNERVHRPSQIRGAGGAEFLADEEEYVFAVGKILEGLSVDQVAGESFRPGGFEFFAGTGA